MRSPVSSGTSGKPYLIRFKDGREISSQEFFIAELNKIDPKPLRLRSASSR